jgi:uncharacterized protein with HEPN domain
VSRDPILFLEDIESACSDIRDFTDGLSKDDVFGDKMRFDAVLMNLYVIGEAAKKIPQQTREAYGDVDWRRIAGMRDFIAHQYFALDLDIIWDAIENDIPELHKEVQKILSELQDETS